MKLDHIKRIKLFNQLKEIDLIDINLRIAWNKYPRNLSLITHHEESSDAYFVSRGKVKNTTFSLSGKEIIYQTIDEGNIFGEISAIDQLGRSTSVVVIEDSIIGKMPSADFWWVTERYPIVSKQLFLHLTGLMRFLCDKIYEYDAPGARDRVRSEVIKYAKQSVTNDKGAVIENMPTYEDIANRISAHRKAVTKEFNYLYKNGYIVKDGKKVSVPDIQKLEGLIDKLI